MTGLKLRGVRKSYGAVEVIKGVDLDIAPGEFVVFVGPSGCGKSTLLRMIAGLEEISGGDLFIGDKRMNDVDPAQRGIAMVFQSYALYPHMTVRENMGFALRFAKKPKDEIAQAVNEAARILELGPLLDRRPKDLSGGQRQRVAIGRAIVRHPDVFLFDEPLSNLDAELRVHMRIEVARLHKELATTIIYVTHDQVEAMTLADKIVVMRAGVVEQVGSPLALYDDPDNLFVAGFIGSPSMNFLHGATVEGGQMFRSGELTLSLAGYDGGAVGAREAAILGLRPEHLSVHDIPDPGHTIPAVVEIDEPMGADSLVWLATSAGQMSVRVPVEARMKPGTKVHLRVDISKASVFDAASELRV